MLKLEFRSFELDSNFVIRASKLPRCRHARGGRVRANIDHAMNCHCAKNATARTTAARVLAGSPAPIVALAIRPARKRAAKEGGRPKIPKGKGARTIFGQGAAS